MKMNDCSIPCEMLYNSTNIPICICTQEEIQYSCPDDKIPVFTQRYVQFFLSDFQKQKNTFSPIIYFLNPGYYLGIIQLDEDLYMLLGPAVGRNYTSDEVVPWINAPLYNDNRDTFLRTMIGLHPVSIAAVQSTFRLAVYIYNQSILEPSAFEINESLNLKEQVNSKLTQSLFDDREANSFHTPEIIELQLTEAIRKGNMAALERISQQPVTGRSGTLSLDKERQLRYLFVTIVSVFARAAMQGGLDYELACSMADSYCQRMDQLSDSNQILILQYEMAKDFCHMVHNSMHHSDYSPTIQTCMDYIHMHTHDPIHLKDLSKVCFLSERRLSAKFRKEVGCNIVDYIQNTRLDEAKMLLAHSHHSISQIATFLSFSNQSYFTSVFKKHCKLTPLEYREKSNRKSD